MSYTLGDHFFSERFKPILKIGPMNSPYYDKINSILKGDMRCNFFYAKLVEITNAYSIKEIHEETRKIFFFFVGSVKIFL